MASREVAGTRLIQRTPAVVRRATFSALYRPLSATKMGSSSPAIRSWSARLSTAATRLTLSLALPSNARQNSGTSPARVVASASIHCFRSARWSRE